MKKSKPTKSNDINVILRMISRDEELERNDGRWVAMNRPYTNKKKYDRKRDRRQWKREDPFIFQTPENLIYVIGFERRKRIRAERTTAKN